MKIILVAVSFIFFLGSCGPSGKITRGKTSTVAALRFINEYTVPYRFHFKGTTVGGLSGIDYDAANELYYLICDDRSQINTSRFYTAKIPISEKGIDSVVFKDVFNLRDKNQQEYPLKGSDPESIRYNPGTGQLTWTSEGERAIRDGKWILQDPSIRNMGPTGRYIDSFALPENMHMQAIEKGPRDNGVFEGMSFADNYRHLFVSVEEPLYEDGWRAAVDSIAWVRFIKFDVQSKQPVAQYAYKVESVAYPPNPPGAYKINGIAEILSLGNDQFIVLERSYSMGRIACTIRLFLANFKKAANIESVSSLLSVHSISAASKRLLLNMDDLGRYIDNVEGLCFGPRLPNGHQTLILVADDNFSEKEKMQFFLFEIIP